jgi:hypothetical protein
VKVPLILKCRQCVTASDTEVMFGDNLTYNYLYCFFTIHSSPAIQREEALILPQKENILQILKFLSRKGTMPKKAETVRPFLLIEY